MAYTVANGMKDSKDTFSYKGWLNSDQPIKRTLAVFGYGAIGQVIVGVVFFIVIIALGVSGTAITMLFRFIQGR